MQMQFIVPVGSGKAGAAAGGQEGGSRFQREGTAATAVKQELKVSSSELKATLSAQGLGKGEPSAWCHKCKGQGGGCSFGSLQSHRPAVPKAIPAAAASLAWGCPAASSLELQPQKGSCEVWEHALGTEALPSWHREETQPGCSAHPAPHCLPERSPCWVREGQQQMLSREEGRKSSGALEAAAGSGAGSH